MLDRNDGGHALAVILADRLDVLEKVHLFAVGADGAGKAGAEPGEVRAAHGVVSVVGVAADTLVVVAGVLQGHLDADVVNLLVDDNDRVDHILGPVEVGDILAHATHETVGFLAVDAGILEVEGKTLVEEGEFPQAVFKSIEIECEISEDLLVGHELDLSTRSTRGADVGDIGDRLAFLIALLVGAAVTADLDGQLGRRTTMEAA